MRAKNFLYESDQRSTIQKIQDLIDNPHTLETIREVAKQKLAKLLPPSPPPLTSSNLASTSRRYTPSVNLNEHDLNKPFSSFYGKNFTCKQIYENLSNMQPTPSDVAFYRQGQIHLMIPPPYLGITKQQCIGMIETAIPGARNITCKFIEDKGYHFTVSLF